MFENRRESTRITHLEIGTKAIRNEIVTKPNDVLSRRAEYRMMLYLFFVLIVCVSEVLGNQKQD